MNDNKQLAKQVARLLGYRIIADCWWEHPENIDNQIKDYALEQFIFSCPTTGLMIEKMERLGWYPYIAHKAVAFGFQYDEGWKTTKHYQYRNRTIHEAIAKAFVEAKGMIKNEI